MKNILFIVVDCFGYTFLSQKRREYPYLNYLFSEGTSFSQAISAASTTSPSIASMLTGCYPFRHGIMTLNGNRLRPKVPFLPEILKEIGYNTYAEVTGPLYPELGLSRGFDGFNHRNQKEYLSNDWGKRLKERFTSGYFREPWFVFLHLWELHQPMQISLEYNKSKYGIPYERALKSLDKNLELLLEDFLNINKTIVILTGDHGEQVAINAFDKLRKKIIMKFYKRLMNFNLFESLRLTVYRKYQLGHGSNISDMLVKVPLLFVASDSVCNNVEIGGQISHVDIFPTLISILGIERFNIKIDGQNYMPYIKNQIQNPEHAAYMRASGIVLPNPSNWLEGVRYRGLKYIRNQNKFKPREWLYNIKDDPEEKIVVKNDHLIEMMRLKLDKIKENALQTEDDNGMPEHEAEEISRKLRDLGYI
jgi:arylsulfatase A-like enzyme